MEKNSSQNSFGVQGPAGYPGDPGELGEDGLLVTEMTRFIEAHYHIRFDETLENGNSPLTTHDFEDIARHFYERGRNYAKQLRELRDLQRRSKLDEFIEIRYHEGMSKVFFSRAVLCAFEMGMLQKKSQLLRAAKKLFFFKF